MITDRFRKHLLAHDWFGVFIDLVVVIAGVMLAFQIDAWGEQRRGLAVEQDYLHRLQLDLQSELQQFESAAMLAQKRLESIRLLDQLTRDRSVVLQAPLLVAQAVEKASWRSFPQINATVYRELQNTGNLSLLRSAELRQALADYYQDMDFDAQLGLNLRTQHDFERATAGILSIDELTAIENASMDEVSLVVSNPRALEIADEFTSRTGAVALLPSLAEHHLYNLKAFEQAMAQAVFIIGLTEELRGK